MAKGIKLTESQKAIRAKLEEIRLLAENTPQASQSKPQTAVVRILKGLRGDINVLGQQVDDALALLTAEETEENQLSSSGLTPEAIDLATKNNNQDYQPQSESDKAFAALESMGFTPTKEGGQENGNQ